MATAAATSTLRVIFPVVWVLFTSISILPSIVSANDHTLVVTENTTLQLIPSLIVDKSPGVKPGTKVLCERVKVQGLSRLKGLKKFPNTIRVKVAYVGSSGRPPIIEVCFHRNLTVGIGMCNQSQWQKLTKGSWMSSMSPFDHKLLDIRLTGSPTEPIEVSLDEEIFFYRVIFLVLGVIMMMLASFLSNSLVFYYSGAMAVGILLVILMVLYQGMKLLPTGRKNSLAIVLYSSMVGLGTFLLRYLPRLLRSILTEIGISEDMYNPLGIFLLVFLVIAGAWLGFWVVHKLVLTEDGNIDVGVSHFVAWSIRILASVMILQSSIDPLLAAEALLCGIFVASILRRFTPLEFLQGVYRRFHRLRKSKRKIFQDKYASPVKESHDSMPFTEAPSSTLQGSTSMSPRQLTDSEAFYSTFHTTPYRRKISKDEWDKFTRDSTKKALENLVSSPDFNIWAAAHADRLTLAPNKEVTRPNYLQRLFHWL
ncbi:unnamed protein product [Coffea canephora]|uniref:Nuclear envelope integral membrane protein 1 n=1 Tax=Coffea canephora TaxID=49390 RepID=A0A068U4S9_COFCA|nr:uncharacterized protein LOC113698045 isoform X1 [Coffea arabica]CDP02613.1 unnamed protein product [Coffea canephora]